MTNKSKLLIWGVILMLFSAGITAEKTAAQNLIVTPQDSLADEPLNIKVINLRPKQPVIIRASAHDSSNRTWQSFAGFYADSKGIVDAAAQAPENGTYTKADVMGLITSMNLPNPDYNRARFTYQGTNPLKFSFSAEINGKIIAEIDITRRFARAGTKIRDVRENKLIGTLFTPAGNGVFPAIIVLGGSEGGLSSDDVAAMLSSHGFVAFSLAYFGMGELPASLEEIPLEYFKQAIEWLKQQPSVKKNSMSVFGTSKGAEAALLAASQYKDIRAVVAYAPSSVAWSCICSTPEKSSWSFQEKPTPFIPQANAPTYQPPPGFPVSPVINYVYRLRNEEALRQAAIPVEKINGPVLLISGRDDQLWNSFSMSQMIINRLKKYKHRFGDRHLAYESAGHLIGKAYLPAGSTLIAGGRLNTGGTPEGNARAQKEAWTQVLDFLKTTFYQ